MTALRIVRPGMLTTIQDLGRWGFQSAGVPVAGPMDAYSHRLANRLVANDDHAAAIEVTLLGPELEVQGDVVCAVAGAEFELFAGRVPVACGCAVTLRSGTRLRFGRRLAGARATLAVRGGIDVPDVLGSRATSLVSRMGPLGGRPLAAGDVLPVGHEPPRNDGQAVTLPLTLPRGGARLRVLSGPHDDLFTPEARDLFYTARFLVAPQSNRMGYRLDGPPLPREHGLEILSDATPIGSVQVPHSGHPILLMADRQTTGGYPKIATVISADIPVAGQLAPGDWVRFSRCGSAEALDALGRMERRLAGRH